MKRLIALALFLVFLSTAALIGCSSQKLANTAYDSTKGAESGSDPSRGSAYDDAGKEHGTSLISENQLPDTGGRKVIFSSSFALETKNFTASCEMLESLIAKYGAYIESSNIYTGEGTKHKTRSATYTLRVPADRYAALLSESGTIGTVISRSDNNRDVSDFYYDIESHLTTLRTKEERLLALLEKSVDIKDIISLNDALEETRYEIESLTGTLKKYDALISYSTINMTITEVSEITQTPEINASLGERISNAFLTSLRGVWAFLKYLLVLISAALPVLILLGFVAAIVLVILFAVRRRSKKKHAAKKQTNPDA